MSNPLILNIPQVASGLQVFTLTLPATGQYNAQVQASVPQALAIGSGAGSGTGLGNGTGGGGEGFVRGDFGAGFGGVGQGFGASNGYQQPSVNITTNPQGASVSSSLVITIVNTTTSTTLYTSTSFVPTQDYLKFKIPFQAALNDVITITYSSAGASDKTLNGLVSTTTIGQGFN